MKKGVAVGLTAFLIVMAVCTVISKGIYKSGLPRVTVGYTEEKAIMHSFSAVSSVEPGQEYGIYVPAGLRVSTICVRTGDTVDADSPLFEVNLKDLGEQIAAAEAERAYLEAQIKDLAAEKKERDKNRETNARRIQEDYDDLVKEHDLRIRDCQLTADQACIRLAEKQTIAGESAESVSGSDIYAVDLLRVDYERAQNAVEAAKLQKEEAIKEWARSLEDAREPLTSELARKVQLQNSLEQVRYALEQLMELEERQGVVRTDRNEMTIQSCFLQIGERTTDRACLIYSTTVGGGVIRVTGRKDETSMLSKGDKVTLEMKAGSNWSALSAQDVEFRISYIESSGEWNTIRVDIPEGVRLSPGDVVRVKTGSRSEKFDKVIERKMLHEDGTGGFFVYVVEQVEGILGTEDRIRKIPVSVKDQNETYAAVESVALDERSEIVTGSDKELREGDVVRVLSE